MRNSIFLRSGRVQGHTLGALKKTLSVIVSYIRIFCPGVSNSFVDMIGQKKY